MFFNLADLSHSEHIMQESGRAFQQKDGQNIYFYEPFHFNLLLGKSLKQAQLSHN